VKHHRPVRPGITQTPFPEPDPSIPPLTQEDLRAYLTHAGTLMYGPTSWQSPLARDVSLTPRSLRRYLDGTRPIPTSLLLTLSRLTFARADALLTHSQDLSSAWNEITSRPVLAGPSKVLVPVPPRHPDDLAPITRRRKYGRDKA